LNVFGASPRCFNKAAGVTINLFLPFRELLILKDYRSDCHAAAADALDQLGWQPSQDEIGVVYWIAKGNWVKCSDIGIPAIGRLINMLKKHMSSEYNAEIEQASKALGRIGISSVEPLLALLKDSYYHNIWEWVISALGTIGDARAVEPLIVFLNDEHARLCRAAKDALGRIGEPAVEPLLVLIKESNEKVRMPAIAALGLIGDSRAVEPLITILNEKNYFVINTTSNALRNIGISAVEPLIVVLKDEHIAPVARNMAARTLGQIGDIRAVEPLITTLNDRNVRLEIVRALSLIGDARAVEPLSAALKDQDEKICKAASLALKDIQYRLAGRS